MLNKIALKIRKLFPNAYRHLLNIKQGRYNYTFDKNKYPYSFLKNAYPNEYNGEKAPEIIYCFWSGNNPLTENRKRGLEELKRNAGVPVKLITPQNLSDYIKPDYPFHKGYELLSLTMRSDYLRCYFMHHYGGGYADVKTFNHSWKPAFDKLNNNKNKYVIGYPEVFNGGLAPTHHRFLEDMSLYPNYEEMKASEEKLYKDLYKHNPLLIGNGAFICKPHTSITKEWYEEVHRRMDDLVEYAEKNNLTEVNIPYFYLVQIFHPIQLKYHKHIIRYPNLLPVLTDYR